MQTFQAYVVRESEGSITSAIEELRMDDLPAGEVVIRVECSSLNYKDALACQGNRAIAGELPHVPGIDLAGEVLSSESDDYQPGDKVLITGYRLGAPDWGGFSQVVRVPAEWIVPMPERMSAKGAMTYGTAGFTAAQCVMAVTDRVAPDAGQVVVTGATGGVGCVALSILVKLGYEVVAISGKEHLKETLLQMGAKEVLPREALADESGKPMLPARWAAAVDTVGGEPLSTLVRSTDYRGVVAACGLVAGVDLPLTVYPFLLRGVTLAGIDSAKCPREPRLEIWRRLSGDWHVELPERMVRMIGLEDLPPEVERMLSGKSEGRTLLDLKYL